MTFRIGDFTDTWNSGRHPLDDIKRSAQENMPSRDLSLKSNNSVNFSKE